MLDLRLGRYQDVLADVTCDAVIVDAPYSARTHSGHNAKRQTDSNYRQDLSYANWNRDDIATFCDFWRERCCGWIVTITDHELAPVWASELERVGRYVFAPLPWVAHGSRVRLAGDGPSCWTCWIVVARPRKQPYSKWGTLPGAYLHSAENHGNAQSASFAERHIGGKPLGLMRALVRDYTRPGDVVCDPCAGAATTLLAAAQEGRKAVGAEMDPATHAKGAQRLADWQRREWQAPKLFDFTPQAFDFGRD